MTEKEYISNIDRLLHSEKKDSFSITQSLLEKFYTIKPVRLGWYVSKAKNVWQAGGSIEQAMNLLADKSWYLFLYPGLKEQYELYIDLVGSYQDISDMQRHKLLFMGICDNVAEDDRIWEKEMTVHFKQIKSDFLQNPESEYIANQLLEYYYIFHNNVLFFILNEYMVRNKIPVYAAREWFLKFPNSGFLSENLEEYAQSPFVIFEAENSDGLDEKITNYILGKLGKKIFLIKTPFIFPVNKKIDIKDTVDISIKNMVSLDNLNTIYSVQIIFDGEILGDNRDYILAHLIQNELKRQFAVVLTSGNLMDNLCCQPILKKCLERLYNFVGPSLENQMVVGWAGSYPAYISQIHDLDVNRLLDSRPEIPYSIVVPARNSAYTLRYTLITCLNQRYGGDYEIVLSDNSTPGNTEVYQLYKELNDSRIRYYRTPREFNLSRSFEFAILHAKGEFILPLGSDDALLPWALDVLDALREVYPDENIIQWERGFYAWPGFNGGQQNQFVIPRDYKKGEFQTEYLSRQFYFNAIFGSSDQMYILPNLYLNSGCRREYLKTILEKTGRLFDGICQDLYMGVVNAAINDKILNIHYPLVIAGMSNSSIGAKANQLHTLNKEETAFVNEMKKMANIGGYCASPYERLMPEVTTDKSSLYNSILRLIARGIIAESDLNHFDFRKWFLDVFRQIDIRDPLFDKKIHYFRYTASLHGEEFLKWFDENIYYDALTPQLVDEEKLARLHEKKCYKEGKNAFGGRTLDASKYNVQNVYDAAKLFEKLTKL